MNKRNKRDNDVTADTCEACGLKNLERKMRTDASLCEDLSREFCRILKDWLTVVEQGMVISRNNAEPDKVSICHTHDFCDANQAMLDAWEIVFGKGEAPAIITEGTTESQKDFDDSIWNEAWAKAKSDNFGFLSCRQSAS